MKKIYTTIIIIGIIAEVVLLLFFDKKIAAYGPVIFWGIALFGILNYGVNIFKLSDSVKKTKPELYKKHSFGIMITRNALSDKEFLGALDDSEQRIIKNNKTIFKFLFLCFGLFAISAILIVLK
ncbi:hypothetical protein [Flammeovirga sp. OC4]|uniref:hypothetical protein n=1 Tax=Flammeovirga sp. OC4 TaxID=1382345 RepID=UPI0005C6B22C|nr:hypothetical protein [Flammeovirga sp. OC4]